MAFPFLRGVQSPQIRRQRKSNVLLLLMIGKIDHDYEQEHEQEGCERVLNIYGWSPQRP
jgi:hypothetical protein